MIIVIARCTAATTICRIPPLKVTNGSCTTTSIESPATDRRHNQRQNETFIARCPYPCGTHCTTNRRSEGYASSRLPARLRSAARKRPRSDGRQPRCPAPARSPTVPRRGRPRRRARARCDLMGVVAHAALPRRIFGREEMQRHAAAVSTRGRLSCAATKMMAIGASGTSRRTNDVLTCPSTSVQLLKR